MMDITHGHLLACPCGAGKPDQSWFGTVRGSVVYGVHCVCGVGFQDETEDGAAGKWNALARDRSAVDLARAVA